MRASAEADAWCVLGVDDVINDIQVRAWPRSNGALAVSGRDDVGLADLVDRRSRRAFVALGFRESNLVARPKGVEVAFDDRVAVEVDLLAVGALD